ncbi:MAG: hypothetical protein KGJ02_01570 [Verrucomicrobiota bacterium]|nr:hypothetical protein [Verrucomicrobiota bacterium]
MKRLLFLLLLSLATACSRNTGDEACLSKNLSPRKQKHRIALLQKKLENAEKAFEKVKDETESLRYQIQNAELALIRRQVEDYEHQLSKLGDHPVAYSNLFVNEREALHRIIQSGPSPASYEAQAVLDQILRFITTISDEDRGS